MNLVVDAGNTFVKLAVFEKTKEVSFQVFALEDFCKKSKEIFKVYPEISHAIVSSVGFLSEKEIAMLSVFCKVHVLSHQSKVPFKNSYATPQTLGVDRMALAAAAFYFNPAGNTLVIDAGTCLTYDMVNDYGEYLGGAISPGVAMRYRAMHQQTSKLPLLEKGEIIDFIGNSTESSMHSGVVNGICNEIDGVISQYKQRFLNLTVIFTGGDAQFLSERVKNTIFAHSKFLLLGLNHLLEYNKR
ncbi:type III pantothenate kinase [Arenibacter nanhaiticus]|uniref:Type III pantothenate kinase n=1 Tax=Arenibacter nanhaiticus TaxID=558155 RepID=A0A1M6F5Q0_9FLAO|nr:type III pantothenate kinase [Arenibacter nanhaiticus]SHI92919.1 type III pantothenate kinase [Arenibacter nanhaiticus]